MTFFAVVCGGLSLLAVVMWIAVWDQQKYDRQLAERNRRWALDVEELQVDRRVKREQWLAEERQQREQWQQEARDLSERNAVALESMVQTKGKQ